MSVHRVITAQDSATERVLVTFLTPDGDRVTERVSRYLADLLITRNLVFNEDEDCADCGRPIFYDDQRETYLHVDPSASCFLIGSRA